MEKCFQYKIVSVLSQSSYEQKMREKDFQMSVLHWSFSTRKLAGKAEKRIEMWNLCEALIHRVVELN